MGARIAYGNASAEKYCNRVQYGIIARSSYPLTGDFVMAYLLVSADGSKRDVLPRQFRNAIRVAAGIVLRRATYNSDGVEKISDYVVNGCIVIDSRGVTLRRFTINNIRKLAR